MESYYGAPHPSAATEHTEEPQLAGYVCTRNTSTATEHADAAPIAMHSPASSQHETANSGEEQGVATERADDTAIEDVLFTIDDARQMRRTFRGQLGVLHTEARQYMNDITNIAGQDDADDVYYIGDSIRWKEYIAMHAQWQDIIGNGIIAAHRERIHNTQDPNRQNKLRVDYVFYRADNTFCRVHPGTKRKNDAQLYCADTSTCYRAVQVHEVAPNPMTFTAAMQIPMKDKMGKAEAWRQLSQRDDASIDVTEHDTFKWWLFLSNLGPNTAKAFGSGITSVQIHKRENIIGLRTEHTDSIVQWVILTPHRNSFKTRLATSFQ